MNRAPYLTSERNTVCSFSFLPIVAVTVSDRSREMVEHYIESQREKAWGGRGRPPKDLEKLQAYHREVLDEGHVGLQGGDPQTS